MNAHSQIKTRSEQRLEQLKALRRPLTEAEQGELYRALHAVYMRDWRRHQISRYPELGQDRNEELRLLAKVRREAQQREWHK